METMIHPSKWDLMTTDQLREICKQHHAHGAVKSSDQMQLPDRSVHLFRVTLNESRVASLPSTLHLYLRRSLSRLQRDQIWRVMQVVHDHAVRAHNFSDRFAVVLNYSVRNGFLAHQKNLKNSEELRRRFYAVSIGVHSVRGWAQGRTLREDHQRAEVLYVLQQLYWVNEVIRVINSRRQWQVPDPVIVGGNYLGVR